MSKHKSFSSLDLKQLYEWYSSGGKFNIYTTRSEIQREIELELKIKNKPLDKSYIDSRTKKREHQVLMRLRKRIVATIIEKNIDIKCNYCNTPLSVSEMTIDHIVPVSLNGKLVEYSNLTPACRKCNGCHGNNIEKTVSVTFAELLEIEKE